MSILVNILNIIPILAVYFAVPTLLLSILQLFLCRKELRWGRILPIFSAVVSVLLTLFILLFSVNLSGCMGHGRHSIGLGGAVFGLLAPMAALAALNIPTLIFYLIYRAEKRRQAQEDLDRMKIDDLE